jgi:hypothetical protein
VIQGIAKKNGARTRYPVESFFLSIAIAVLAVVLSLIMGNSAVTNGLVIGSVIGITFFLVTWWMISCIVRSKKDKSANPLLAILAIKLFILKFPLVGLALWLAFKYLQINPFALIFGIAIVQIAMLASALVKMFGKKE